MNVEVHAHFEDMVKQLMIAKGFASPAEIVEQAVAAMYDGLSDDEKNAAVNRMVDDGFASGVYEGDPFEAAFETIRRSAEERKIRSAA